MFKQGSQIRVPNFIIATIVGCRFIAVVGDNFPILFLLSTILWTEILVAVFQCMPVSEFWDRYAPPFARTNCRVNAIRFCIGNSIPNIFTDAAILVLHIPFI